MEEPQPYYTQFYREEGPYDWFDHKKIVVRYTFLYPEEVDLMSEFTIDLEYDEFFDQTRIAPVDLARWLAEVYSTKYISHDHRGEIDKVITYLSQRRKKDKEELKKYELAYAEYQVEYWTKKLTELRKKYNVKDNY